MLIIRCQQSQSIPCAGFQTFSMPSITFLLMPATQPVYPAPFSITTLLGLTSMVLLAHQLMIISLLSMHPCHLPVLRSQAFIHHLILMVSVCFCRGQLFFL